MKHVYSPSGSAEAHMIAHMLGQAGIRADIQGEALLGAVGELPASGLIKIAVADNDYESARKLIWEWEQKNPPETLSQPLPKTSKPALIVALLAGALIGWGVNEQGLMSSFSENIDHNKDGKPDLVWSYKNKNSPFPETSEDDRNFDGKIDMVTKYDSKGSAVSSKIDNNFDGIFETTTIYKNGSPAKSETDKNGDGKTDIVHVYENSVPLRSEVDTDGDGKMDLVELYEHGLLKQTQIMNPSTGKVARVNHYENFMLQSADFDSDGDGTLDTHYTYDRYEQVIKTEKK